MKINTDKLKIVQPFITGITILTLIGVLVFSIYVDLLQLSSHSSIRLVLGFCSIEIPYPRRKVDGSRDSMTVRHFLSCGIKKNSSFVTSCLCGEQ